MSFDRWIVRDPDDGWISYTTEEEARAHYCRALDDLERESSDGGWHEDVESLAVYRLVPVLTTRLRRIASAEDETEEGERCREEGWDYIAAAETVQS